MNFIKFSHPNKNIIKNAILCLAVFFVSMLSFVVIPSTKEIDNVRADTWTTVASTGFFGGTGTIDDPYLISNANELAFFASKVNSGTTYSGKYISLTNDISLAGYTWVPIGYYSSYHFDGSFNGNGFTISEMNPVTRGSCTGLFGWTNNAKLSNFSLRNSVISADGVSYCGAVAGLAQYYSTFTNIQVIDTTITSSSSSYIGGLIGLSENNTISRVAVYNSDPSIYLIQMTGSASYIGGLVGRLYYSTVTESFCNATVSGYSTSEGSLGGICGYSTYSTISNCYAAGVRENAYRIGGLIGYCSNSTTANNNYVVGTGATNAICARSSISWSNNFYLSSLASSSYGTAKTAVEMRFQDTYTGWDFISVWSIFPSINDGFPYLLNNYEYAHVSMSAFVQDGFGTVEISEDNDIFTITPTLDDGVSFVKWVFNGVDLDLSDANYTYNAVDNSLSFNDDLSLLGSYVLQTTGSADTWYAYASTGFAGGTGTAVDPYLIATPEQLAFLSKSVFTHNLDTHFLVTTNLDMGAHTWSPIGGGVGQNHYQAFVSNFDGNGKIISNLNIAKEINTFHNAHMGLFGYCSGANIVNLAVENVDFNLTSSVYVNVGAIVGSSSYNTRISRSYATGQITVNKIGTPVQNFFIGGISGSNSQIDNCYSSVNINSDHNNSAIGGIIGQGGQTRSVYSVGTITSSGAYRGVSGRSSGNNYITSYYLSDSPLGFGEARTSQGLKNLQSMSFDTNIWVADVSVNDGYPVLKQFATGYVKGIVAGNGGYVKGSGFFAENDIVELVPVLKPNYSFVKWQKNGADVDTEGGIFTLSANNSLSFTVSSSTSGDYVVVTSEGEEKTYWEDQQANNLYSSDGNTYIINSLSDLTGFMKTVNGGYDFANKTVRLNANLNLSDHYWTPIGFGSYKFAGIFDGAGHTISNVFIDYDVEVDSTNLYYGFFGTVARDATTNSVAVIKNLGLIDINYDISSRKNIFVGSLVGRLGLASLTEVEATVEKCFTTGSITYASETISGSIISGLVGWDNNPTLDENTTTITDCFSTVDMNIHTARIYQVIAGLISKSNSRTRIVRSYYAGITDADFSLVLRVTYGLETDCYISQSSAINVSGNVLDFADLRTTSSFENYDFYTLWHISTTPSYEWYNGGMPFLIGVFGEAYVILSVNDGRGTIEVVGESDNYFAIGDSITISVTPNSGYVVSAWHFNNELIEGFQSTQRELVISKATSGYYRVTLSQNANDWRSQINDFAPGEYGTQENPIMIRTPEQLANLAVKCDEDAQYCTLHYKLAADIDLDGNNWSGINNFKGTFDGNGHSISNINNDSTDNLALFITTEDATIKDLTVEYSFDFEKTVPLNFGGIVYDSTSTDFINCHVDGTIAIDSTSDVRAGGLVCYARSKLVESVTKNTTFYDCVNSMNITISSQNLFVGLITSMGGELTLCQNFGNIIVSSTNEMVVGGLVAEGVVDIKYCENLGNISLQNNKSVNTIVGGVVGNVTGVISEVASHGNIIIETISVLTVERSFIVGGIAGITAAPITDSYNASPMTLSGDYSWKVGGIAGQTTAIISKTYTIGTVSCDCENATINAIAGETTAELINSYYLDTIFAESENGLSKTVLEMQTPDTYLDWNFESYWRIYPTTATEKQKNGGYPNLLSLNEYYVVRLSSNDNILGSVAGSGAFGIGEEVFLDATPASGYFFHYWQEQGEVFSSIEDYTYNANKHAVVYIMCVFSLTGNFWDKQEATPMVLERVYYASSSYYYAYVIRSVENLVWYLNMVNQTEDYLGLTFDSSINTIYLTVDIDLGANIWVPIGTKTNPVPSTHTFRGNGHTISNVHFMEITDVSYYGFFGNTTAPIMDLTINNVDFNIEIDSNEDDIEQYYIGGLVGYSTSTVANCNVFEIANKIDGENLVPVRTYGELYVGGMVGCSTSTITTAEVTGSLVLDYLSTLRSYAGGVAGVSSTLTNVISKVILTETGFRYVGGVVGMTSGSMTQCHNYYTITGSLNLVDTVSNSWPNIIAFGGVSGISQGSMTSCFNYADISLTYNINDIDGELMYVSVGGLVGYIRGSNIITSFNRGDVYCNVLALKEVYAGVGGIAGRVQNTTIRNVYNAGNVTLTNTADIIAEIETNLESITDFEYHVGCAGLFGSVYSNASSYTQQVYSTFNYGAITNTSELGDAVGRGVNVMFYGNYFLTGTAKVNSDYAVSLSSAQLRDKNNLYSFDFVNIWHYYGSDEFAIEGKYMSPEALMYNDGYPNLGDQFSRKITLYSGADTITDIDGLGFYQDDDIVVLKPKYEYLSNTSETRNYFGRSVTVNGSTYNYSLFLGSSSSYFNTTGQYLYTNDFENSTITFSMSEDTEGRYYLTRNVVSSELLHNMQLRMENIQEFYTEMREVDGNYYVDNLKMLRNFSYRVNTGETFENKTVYLTADIELDALETYTPYSHTNKPLFVPIGLYSPFKGTFDGQGYSLFDLMIYPSATITIPDFNTTAGFGLFGNCENAKLLNFSVKGHVYSNVTVSNGTNNLKRYTGMVCGIARESTVIQNVKAYGMVSSPAGNHYGGLVGLLEGSLINNCFYEGIVNITAASTYSGASGGLVGEVFNGTVRNTYFDGVMSLYNSFQGGIAGITTNAVFENVLISGKQNSSGYYYSTWFNSYSYDASAGGAVGYSMGELTLKNISLCQEITNNYYCYLGLIVGEHASSSATNRLATSYSYVSIDGMWIYSETTTNISYTDYYHSTPRLVLNIHNLYNYARTKHVADGQTSTLKTYSGGVYVGTTITYEQLINASTEITGFDFDNEWHSAFGTPEDDSRFALLKTNGTLIPKTLLSHSQFKATTTDKATISITGDVTEIGQSVSITATVNDDEYQFDSWYFNGSRIDPSNSIFALSGENNKTITFTTSQLTNGSLFAGTIKSTLVSLNWITTETTNITHALMKYEITSANDLIWVAQQTEMSFEGYTFVLTQDIDLTGKEWTSIGQTIPFKGSFNGQGHTITGLGGIMKNGSGLLLGSLFANVAYPSVISNLSLTVNIENYNANIEAIGGIAAKSYSAKFYRCYVDGSIISSAQTTVVGGLVGQHYISRTDESNRNVNKADLTGYIVGGIFGEIIASYSDESTINYSVNFGTIIGTVGGGIVGVARYAILSGVSNYGDVTAYIGGGIIGIGDRITLRESYNAGNISQTSLLNVDPERIKNELSRHNFYIDNICSRLSAFLGAYENRFMLSNAYNNGMLLQEDENIKIETGGWIVGSENSITHTNSSTSAYVYFLNGTGSQVDTTNTLGKSSSALLNEDTFFTFDVSIWTFGLTDETDQFYNDGYPVITLSKYISIEIDETIYDECMGLTEIVGGGFYEADEEVVLTIPSVERFIFEGWLYNGVLIDTMSGTTGYTLGSDNSLHFLAGIATDGVYKPVIVFAITEYWIDSVHSVPKYDNDTGYYEIYTAQELVWFAKQFTSSRSYNVRLCADIDLSSKLWIPIGYTSVTDTSHAEYYGAFYGRGHTITGMQIVDYFVYVGFFAYVRSSTIKELNFSNAYVSVSATTLDSTFVGTVVGYWYYSGSSMLTYNGTIESTVEAINYYEVGLFAGYYYRSGYEQFSQLWAYGSVIAKEAYYVGGVFGRCYATLNNVYSNVNLSVENARYTAGISTYSGSITQSAYDGDINTLDVTNVSGMTCNMVSVNTYTISNSYVKAKLDCKVDQIASLYMASFITSAPSSFAISYCYSTTKFLTNFGAAIKAPLFYSNYTPTVTSCFFLGAQGSSTDYGVGWTSNNMKGTSLYNTYSSSVWDIVVGTFPALLALEQTLNVVTEYPDFSIIELTRIAGWKNETTTTGTSLASAIVTCIPTNEETHTFLGWQNSYGDVVSLNEIMNIRIHQKTETYTAIFITNYITANITYLGYYQIARDYMEVSTAQPTISSSTSGNWSSYVAGEFAGGDGSEQSPYEIESPEQLARLASLTNGGQTFENQFFILVDDINLSTRYWTSIGTDSKRFKGTFDGYGHVIAGVKQSGKGSYNGLFGCVQSATIKNLLLRNCSFTSITGGYNGTLCGVAYESEITNIRVYETLLKGSSSADYTGGLIGMASSTTILKILVKNSGTSNSISFSSTGDVHYGGIVGYLNGGSIDQAGNEANVYLRYNYGYAGGIAGYSSSSATISNSYNTGTLSPFYYGAGICYGSIGSITNCYSTGGYDTAHRYNAICLGGSPTAYSGNYYFQGSSSYGTSKTLAEMQQQSTFVGWDFNDIWQMSEGGTPVLRANYGDINMSSIRRVLTVLRAETVQQIRYENFTMRVDDVEGYQFYGYSINNSDRVYSRNVLVSKVLYSQREVLSFDLTIHMSEHVFVDFEAYMGSLNPRTMLPSEITEETYPTPVRYGYTFDGWYEDDEYVREAITYDVASTYGYSIVLYAKWIPIQILIYGEVSNSVYGEVSGVGYVGYSETETTTLTVTAYEGYQFDYWSCDGDIYALTTSITVPRLFLHDSVEGETIGEYEDVHYYSSYVAHFRRQMHQITVTKLLGGNVSGSGFYEHNRTALITAIPAEKYRFVGWFVDGVRVSEEPTYSFVVLQEATYEARFVGNDYRIIVNVADGQSEHGSVTAENDGYTSLGGSLEITAYNEVGYVFLHWLLNGEIVSTSSTYTITNIEDDATYTAVFGDFTPEYMNFDGAVSVTPDLDGVYNITTIEKLNWFRKEVNLGNHFSGITIKLMANLDFTEEDYFSPIGDSSENAFAGVFDFNGYSILGLRITNVSAYRDLRAFGLFGFVIGGQIKNAVLNNISMDISNGDSAGLIMVGGLVGFADINTIITNSTVDGNIRVRANETVVGGFVGKSDAEITNSYSLVDLQVKANQGQIGGLVGELSGNLNYVYYKGTINAVSYGDNQEINVGGLVGFGSNSKVYNAFAIPVLSVSEGIYVGSVIGYLDSFVNENLGGVFVNSSTVYCARMGGEYTLDVSQKPLNWFKQDSNYIRLSHWHETEWNMSIWYISGEMNEGLPILRTENISALSNGVLNISINSTTGNKKMYVKVSLIGESAIYDYWVQAGQYMKVSGVSLGTYKVVVTSLDCYSCITNITTVKLDETNKFASINVDVYEVSNTSQYQTSVG